jgi:hypothetical protein
MATITKALYDTDFVEWTAQNAELLRQGRFDEVDLEHVAEEIEDLGKRDLLAVRSQLRRMLMHSIKQKIQPERDGASWRGSIVTAQGIIIDYVELSPSLRRQLTDSLPAVYRRAIKEALSETGLAGQRKDLGIPETCPFSLSQLVDGDVDSLQI